MRAIECGTVTRPQRPVDEQVLISLAETDQVLPVIGEAAPPLIGALHFVHRVARYDVLIKLSCPMYLRILYPNAQASQQPIAPLSHSLMLPS